MDKNQHEEGLILAVQGPRFRLLTTDGRSLLLTLPHEANLEFQDLIGWMEANHPVAVTYRGEPNFISGRAVKVEPL